MAKQIPYTQLALKWCRAQGWTGDVVERWIPAPWMGRVGSEKRGAGGFRKDFLGLADIVMVDPTAESVVLVQSTSHQQRKAHLDKMLCNDYLPVVSKACRVLLLTFRPIKAESGRVIRYEPKPEGVCELWKASSTTRS